MILYHILNTVFYLTHISTLLLQILDPLPVSLIRNSHFTHQSLCVPNTHAKSKKLTPSPCVVFIKKFGSHRKVKLQNDNN